MSLLDIHVLGSPILRQETERVEQVTPELRRLVDNMFDTMEAAKGVGLAAPQVGRTERLAVVDADDVRLVIINPEIVLREGLERGEEGCLSIPEVYADVDRPARVIVRAQDIDLNWFEVDAANLLGRCLQHEIDHLHGKLFTDRLSLLKKRAAMRDWEQEKTKYPKLLRVLPVGDLPPER
ncbi:peptide deformylase [Gemmatimonas aurantiaca]|uniref:peptide deformylase n=1 Tax=Gemmatimonas aurantiaca TaxID=173480 RepID=UPI00301C2039